MPNPGLDSPHRKVTLNLWEEDVYTLRVEYGSGWSGKVRDIVHQYLLEKKRARKAMATETL